MNILIVPIFETKKLIVKKLSFQIFISILLFHNRKIEWANFRFKGLLLQKKIQL